MRLTNGLADGLVAAALLTASTVGWGGDAAAQGTTKSLCQVDVPTAEPARRGETVGFMKRAEGQVKVFRGVPGAAEELDATVGMDLFATDAVVTGADGGFDIIFTDNSTMSGVSDTCVEIADYLYEPADEASKFTMRLGRGVVSISAGEVAKIRDDAMKVIIRNDTNLAVTGTRIVIRAR